jgi:hypothetical protein
VIDTYGKQRHVSEVLDQGMETRGEFYLMHGSI